MAELTEQDKLLAFFKRPETHKTIFLLVKQFSRAFGTRWFTVQDCIDIFKESSQEQILDILNTLQLCGYILNNVSKGKERLRLSGSKLREITEGSQIIE